MTNAFFLRLILTLTLAALTGVARPAMAQLTPAEETVIDVRNGDQKGKLSIRVGELSFDSLTDAKQSRTWKYADIRTFEKRIIKGIRVRPFKGSRYDFSFDSIATRDRIFGMVSQRIVDARKTKTK